MATRLSHDSDAVPTTPSSQTPSRPGTRSPGPRWSSAASVLDGTAPPGRPRPDPAGDAQPARPGRRRHRHRQDQDAAADGRAAVGRRRAGVPRRHQGRPVRAWPRPGEPSDKITRARRRRSARRGRRTAYPVEFLALGGQGTGIPVRATMTSFGPILLSQGARAQRRPRSPASAWSSTTPTRPGLPLLDLKDLRAVVQLPHQRRGQGRPRRSSAGCRRRRPG